MDNIYQSITTVRSKFSETMDKAIYDRPQFINRTRDIALLVGSNLLNNILSESNIHYMIAYNEEDNVYTITNNELSDIIAWGDSKEQALSNFENSLLEYAGEYYGEFGLYSRTPNRKNHLPYIVRILSLGTADKIKEMLVCQSGKN